MSDKPQFRTERDSMGEMQVPVGAYYGAQTQRAVENFPISDLRLPRTMIRALGVIKRSAAIANRDLGLLDSNIAEAIIKAAEKVEAGELDEHFVVDIFQTGSGTSSNMNTNEVIAYCARESTKGELNVHPNDHVNMSQSSNDVIPTAIHVAAALELREQLIPALTHLSDGLGKKAVEFDDIVKTGRTHLQDATPIRLGQEFSGYQSQILHGIERLERGLHSITELPQGGTAVGTGLNTHVEFAKRTIAEISARTGIEFREASNHFEAQSAKDAVVELSGHLKTLACSFAKIADDVRWLGTGPRCGLGEIALPSVQPGSSIMPGKVNPVICESVLMVCSQVVGNDSTVTICGYSGGNFELNVMMPAMAYNVLQSLRLLSTSAVNFEERCIAGLEPNRERLHELAEASIASCTALVPKLGYDKVAELAKEAFKTGEPIRTVVERHQLLPKEELDEILDLRKMTEPGL